MVRCLHNILGDSLLIGFGRAQLAKPNTLARSAAMVNTNAAPVQLFSLILNM